MGRRVERKSAHREALETMPMIPHGDTKLLQILDVALTGVAQRSGDVAGLPSWLHAVLRGVFAIHQLDAARLRAGLAELARTDPERAAAVRERARRSVERLTADFPGRPRHRPAGFAIELGFAS